MKEQFLLEQATPKVVAGPVDLNTAAIVGTRVDMSKFKRVTFLVILAAGTTTTDHLFTLQQHNAAASGTTKVLPVMNPYYHKIGAATVFTKVEPTVDTSAYDLHALLSNSAAVVAFEVLQEDLDVNNNFTHVSLDLADSGGAQLVTVIAFGHNATEKPAYAKSL